MKLLLDTHALLWYAINDPQLSSAASAAILDAQNEVYMSAVSHWEMAIKISIGKLQMHSPFREFLETCENEYMFALLPILPTHSVQLSNLPFVANHRDPFDRMLVAQAMVENMTLVSKDEAIDQYSISRIW